MSSNTTGSNQQNIYRRQKRKRKNSRFLSNAKGFAKQGIYGRGTQIEDEQFKYFVNILDTMKKGFEDLDDKVTMANNVFNQTEGKETYLSCNQIVSKVLESLIGFVNADILDAYIQAFSDNFRPLCSDRFASHVLQKMVEVAFLRSVEQKLSNDGGTEEPVQKKLKSINNNLDESSYNTTTKFPNEHRIKCREFLLKVSKFLLNNLEDFVWDPCANHIMRTCILSLAGIHVPKVSFEKGSTEIAKNRTDYMVPDEWHEVMKEYAQRLEMWPQFIDFPYEEHSSALLSVICLALKIIDKKLLKHLGKKILMKTFLRHDDNENDKEKKEIKILNGGDCKNDDNNDNTNVDKQNDNIILPKVFAHQSSLLLLETLLEVAGPKLLTQLYVMLFQGRIATLACSSMANFSVQKLLKRINEKTEFECIFEELNVHLEELLHIGHTGVVIALTSTCLRLQVKQSAVAAALQNALHVTNDKKSFFLCLIKLKPLDVVKKEESTHFVHLHGSLIIQDILKFNKPILLVNCILETPVEQLVWIFNTPNGSHICDAFFESKYIGEKSREKLLRHLEGFYVDLVITKFGSRVVEACFYAAQDQQKTKIAKELVDKSNMVKGSPFGKTVYHNLRLETFRLSVKQWQSSLHQQQSKQSTKDSKTVKLFKDLVN